MKNLWLYFSVGLVSNAVALGVLVAMKLEPASMLHDLVGFCRHVSWFSMIYALLMSWIFPYFTE